MNIMYLCDNNYIDIAGVSIVSLLKNNTQVDKITIYLVSDNVSTDNLDLIVKSTRNDAFQIGVNENIYVDKYK